MPEIEIKTYLNRYLPKDISIKEVSIESDRFHSRYNTSAKTYIYKIWNEEYTNPFMRKYSMHVEEKLDLKKMKTAAEYFLGEHDFTAFSNAKSKKKSMVREIYSIDFEKKDGFIQIRISGNGFLYNMVRKIVGTLIEVGTGRLQAENISKIIELKDRAQVSNLADPGGLYLEKIEFKS